MQYVCITHFLYFSVQTFTHRTPRWNRSKSEFQRAATVAFDSIFSSGSKQSRSCCTDCTMIHGRNDTDRREKLRLSVFRRSPSSPEGYSPSLRDRFIAWINPSRQSSVCLRVNFGLITPLFTPSSYPACCPLSAGSSNTTQRGSKSSPNLSSRAGNTPSIASGKRMALLSSPPLRTHRASFLAVRSSFSERPIEDAVHQQ
jgi:hypothetical protein